MAAEERFDTSTDVGKPMMGLLVLLASFECTRVAEQNAYGRRAITQDERYQGGNAHLWCWTGGNLPLDYTTDEKRIVIDPEQADIVRRI